LKALGFLAEDGDRLGRFLALTGTSPAELRRLAGEAQFLAGVLDHLRSDQSLLLAFAESQNLDPAVVDLAARSLGGGES